MLKTKKCHEKREQTIKKAMDSLDFHIKCANFWRSIYAATWRKGGAFRIVSNISMRYYRRHFDFLESDSAYGFIDEIDEDIADLKKHLANYKS